MLGVTFDVVIISFSLFNKRIWTSLYEDEDIVFNDSNRSYEVIKVLQYSSAYTLHYIDQILFSLIL